MKLSIAFAERPDSVRNAADRFRTANLTRQPCTIGRNFGVSGNLSNTDIVMNNTFWIGVYPGLTDEMLGFAAGKIEAFIGVNY